MAPGRLPTTWYKDSYCKVPMNDMRMRSARNYTGAARRRRCRH